MNRESVNNFPVPGDDDLSSNNSEDELQYDSDREDGYTRYMDNIPVIADLEELSNELIINEDHSMEDDSNSSQEPKNVEWKNFEGKQKKFKFTGSTGFIKELPKDMKPIEAFSLFVDDEVIVDCLEENDVGPFNQGLTSTSQNPRIKKLKPLAVIAYERAKSGIGLSGQIIPFVKALQKGMKWYRKLGLQLILGISLINALIVYRLATNHKIHIRVFKEQLIAELLGSNIVTKATDPSHQKRQPITHNITIRKDENGKKIRRTCVFCYSQKKQCLGRVEARRNTKKPTTYCPVCPKQPHLCIECFAKYHER
ncbi:hypothetical protein KM043_004616 [Ampulex compressa]|nr:hypothetical protein KM043_004616 [Ampulex compressa]